MGTNTFRGTISMHPKNSDSGVANTNTRYGRFHFKLEDNASNNVCYYKFSLEQGELGRMQIHELKDLEIRGSSGTVNSTFRENATKNAREKREREREKQTEKGNNTHTQASSKTSNTESKCGKLDNL